MFNKLIIINIVAIVMGFFVAVFNIGTFSIELSTWSLMSGSGFVIKSVEGQSPSVDLTASVIV